jgi:PAS domain S-box-containing protein
MGISALDDMLGGGIFVGSSTFITGSPGTGKSTLGLSFIAEGLKNGEICLYAGFEESKKQVLRNAKNFGWDFEKYEREGLLVMRCIYPNEKHLEEHLADIRQIVEEKKIKRCVVDPLSAISSAFSPDVFISFSKRLNGYLKTREVTPLFTSASTSLIENTKDVDTHLSTLSDNIILLRYVEMQGDVQCVINIIKMRGSEHSKSLRIYNITDKGLVVGKSLEGYEGVTTGVSKKIAELEEESKELKEVIKQKEMAEKVLRESEEKFRLLFSDSPLGIALVDPEGIIKEVNNSLLQVLSIRKEEFIGKNFVQLISVYGLDAQEQTSDFKNRIAGKPSKREITFLSKDNKKVTITVQSSVIKSNDVIIGVLFILEDITERKRVEGMLSETNQYLDTRFNHAFESLTGRSVIDVIGKPLEILFPPDQVENSMELIRKTRRGNQWEVVEIDVLHLDGSIKTVLWNSANLFAPDGKTLIATIAQGQDITKRKKAQEELKESEEKFRDLFENANDLIQSADVNGRFIYVNKKWLMTLGYTEDEVKSLTITDILRKDQIPHCMEIINEVRSGKSFEKVETVFMSKDGREIYVEGGANAKFKDGKFIATRGFFRDITERKQAEQVLRDSEERFRAIFDCTIDGIIIADIENKKFVIGNKAICNMLGYSIDEFKNLGVMEIHPQEDLSFVVEQFEKLARKEIALAENIPMKRKDGSIFYADINSVSVTLAGKTYLLGSFRDITMRKQAQADLQVANEKLNQIKSDFFEVTTREIRSPLTTIKGYMEMLSNRTFGEINDEQKKYLDIMLRNANQLDNIVSDLVDISSIESGDMTFTLEKTSVSKMVNEAVEKIQSSANVKNIAVNVEIEDHIPDLIVDHDWIIQVIINILGYTIKFSPDKTTVNLRAKKQETDVLFEIQDQGMDIPKDKQKKIFKAFYKAEEGKSEEYSGGGIRLALSRGIVTIHGGKMWVESKDGKGSTFRFTLPIKPVDNIQTKCKESDIFESKKDDENIEIN